MTRRLSATAGAAILAGLVLAGLGTPGALAAPPPADPFPVQESFDGAFASDQWVLPDPGNNATTLTSDALRITSAATGGTGNATLAQSFSSDVAFTATFDFQAFGGGFPGDAFAFFLMDGAQAPNLGIGGGAAGYAGMQGAYVGIGFDNIGNFATDGQAPFQDAVSNSVVIRGAADATGTGPRWPVLARTPQTIQTDGVDPRTVTVEVEPSGADSILLTVIVDGTTLYDAADVRTLAPADPGVSRLQPARPATFAIGFSAGTGGATNNYDIVSLQATADADLSVTKSGPTTLEPGDVGTWTLTAANDDTNPVTGATLTDSGLPADMADASWTCVATAGVCPADAGDGTGPWSLDLERGGSATVTVTGTVPDSAAGTSIVNAAEIAAPADRTETDLSDNTASSTTVVLPFPDLATTAALTSGEPLQYGGTATWSVSVTSIGDGDAPGATATIILPAVVDPDSVVLPAGCTVSAPAGPPATATCDLGDLAPADEVTIPVSGEVSGDVSACTEGPAVLVAEATTTRRELDTDNNAATVESPCVVPVDVSVTKSSGGDAEVGGSLEWTIVVSNAADAPAPATRVVDELPDAATWTCRLSDGASCPVAEGTGSIDLTLEVPAGGSATIVATAPATAPGTVTNTVEIMPCEACVDESASDDTASAQAVVTVPTPTPTPTPEPTPTPAPTSTSDPLPATGGSLSPWVVTAAAGLLGLGVVLQALHALRRRTGERR